MNRSTWTHLVLLCILGGMPTALATAQTGDNRTAAERQQDARGEWRSLLGPVNPRRAEAGEWTKSDRGLETRSAPSSRTALPGPYHREYDFRARFTRRTGHYSIGLFFLAGNGQAGFEVDAWGAQMAGFQMINGRDLRENGTGKMTNGLTNGRAYTMLVEVRRDVIRGYLDDKLVVEYKTNGDDLSMLELWNLRDNRCLGIGAFESETIFHSVEYRAHVPAPSERPSATARPPTTQSTGARTDPGVPNTNAEIAIQGNDLRGLSDEFDAADARSRWARVFRTEGWGGANHLERFDAGRYREGWLSLSPYACIWFGDHRGPLVFKELSGDFVVTTRVRTSGLTGRRAPKASYSVAGLMVRAPRPSGRFEPRQEDYLLLGHGCIASNGQRQYIHIDTKKSVTQMRATPTEGETVELRIARLGAHVFMLRREPEGAWRVQTRMHRPDLPERLQVGLTAFSDRERVRDVPPEVFARQVIRDGRPDLLASFDFVRFQRPAVTDDFRERLLASGRGIRDVTLVQALGGESEVAGR